MGMKQIAALALLAATSAANAADAPPAAPADYVVIRLEKAVARPPAAVWAKIGPYCAISDWLKMTCALTHGTGEVGTIRRLNGSIDEVAVWTRALTADEVRLVNEAEKAGKASGILIFNADEYPIYHNMGMRFIACGADASFVANAASEMATKINAMRDGK